MRRDLEQLAGQEFDLLVVGAGIYGSAIAWDAAQRGLTVALVDQADFGAGTSFNNAKTLHGGVRSLQSGRVGELREYVRERRAMMRIAPHLVRPLPFVVPATRSLTRNPLAFGAYFSAYDLLSADRNQGLDPARRLPGSRLLSRAETLRLDPVADPAHITGGVLWHDGQMTSGERMTLAFAKSAAGAGAVVANHARVERWRLAQDRVIGAQLRDELAGGSFDVRARLTVNATGPHAASLIAPLFDGTCPPIVPALSVAMNLVTRRVVSDAAVGGVARGRLFFLAPWRDVTIAGTSHDPFSGDAASLRTDDRLVERLLSDLNVAFPRARLRLEDVRLVHRGLLPAASVADDDVRLLKTSVVRDHARDGRPGMMSVVGVRYTTARHTAAQATDLACRLLGRTGTPCRTATTPLAGGNIPDLGTFLERSVADRGPHLTEPAARRLAQRFGDEWPAVRALIAAHPSLGEPLTAGCDTLAAEIVFAAREEMALTLGDVLRRTDLGSSGCPGRPAIDAAAGLLGRELSWSAARIEQEIATLESTYPAGSLH